MQTTISEDGASFYYHCPRCAWQVLAQAEPDRGLKQPARGLVAAHLDTHRTKTVIVVDDVVDAQPEKRKRGRPKGSKNKPKPIVVAARRGADRVRKSLTLAPVTARKRGRPKGSKNKPK